MADFDAWQETCLIAISKIGGSDVSFQGLTETVDPDLGEKDVEGIVLVNGGRVTKFTPEGDSTVTFEAYPLEAGTDSGTTGKGFFDLLHSADATQPLAITNTRARDKYRVSALWTDDTTATSATGAITTPSKAERISLANGYFTSVKPSFTDGVLKFTVVYKTVAFTKAGDGNIKHESTDGTENLPALNAYTSTTPF